MLSFAGFNKHYGNSRLKVSFRISKKLVRAWGLLLSSLLNACIQNRTTQGIR
jgi:hypothetical protein